MRDRSGSVTSSIVGVVVDVGAAHQADRRLDELVGQLPQYRKRALMVGRVALKATIPATGTLPGAGSARTPPILFKAGDVSTCTYDGIGTLVNPIEGAAASQ